MIVIGLSAKAQHGKGSTVQLAQIWLQKGDNEVEVRQVSFATALKTMAHDLIDGVKHPDLDLLPQHIALELSDLGVALTHEDLYKKTPRGRKFLQYIGTEAFRKSVDDQYWVLRAAAAIDALPKTTKVVFIPDVRFLNEAEAVKAWGGEMWRLERYVNRTGETFVEPFDNGLSPEAKAHPSETALDNYTFDQVIRHDTMDSLFHAVEAELKRLGLMQ